MYPNATNTSANPSETSTSFAPAGVLRANWTQFLASDMFPSSLWHWKQKDYKMLFIPMEITLKQLIQTYR